MKYIGVTYDRQDICLPARLDEEIRNVANAARTQIIKDLTTLCLKLSVPARRKTHIISSISDDGIQFSISVPEEFANE